MLCLDKKTGKETWRSAVSLKMKERRGKGGFGKGGKGKGKGGFGGKREYSTAGYSSAIVAEVGGVRQYVQFLAGGVVGVSAKDGKLLWHFDDIGGNANCATPIFADDSVFVSASYGSGCGRAKLSLENGKMKAEKVYHESALANQHGGVLLVDGYVYGTNNASLLCVKFEDGSTAWTDRMRRQRLGRLRRRPPLLPRRERRRRPRRGEPEGVQGEGPIHAAGAQQARRRGRTR